MNTRLLHTATAADRASYIADIDKEIYALSKAAHRSVEVVVPLLSGCDTEDETAAVIGLLAAIRAIATAADKASGLANDMTKK